MHLVPAKRSRPHPRAGQYWYLARGLTRLLAVLVSATLLVAVGYAWYNYRRLNVGLQRLTVNVGQQPAVKVSDQPTHDIDGKDENLLVVGNDDRTGDTPAELRELDTGEDGGSLATDTMMIVHIPADGKQATLISLPRDSYVDIPGYGEHKLNSAYADGYTSVNGSLDAQRVAGANLLIETIEQLTGLTIDHFVEVNLYGFYTISNAIGGVRVNLCQAEKDTNSGFDQPAGWDTLVGTQALAFVRQRDGLPGGDLSREKRQQYFLAAAFRKIETAGVLLNPGKLGSLVSAVDSSIYVDQSLQLTSLAEQMANLTANNIVGVQMPTEGNITTSDGDALQVDPAQVKAFMLSVIAEESASSTASSSTASTAAAGGASSAPVATATPSSPPDTGCIN